MKQKATKDILNIIRREEETTYTASAKMILKLARDQIKDIIENKRDVVSHKLMEDIITQTRHMEAQAYITRQYGNGAPREKIEEDISVLVALFDNIYSEGLYERTLKGPRQNLDIVSQDFNPNI